MFLCVISREAFYYFLHAFMFMFQSMFSRKFSQNIFFFCLRSLLVICIFSVHCIVYDELPLISDGKVASHSYGTDLFLFVKRSWNNIYLYSDSLLILVFSLSGSESYWRCSQSSIMSISKINFKSSANSIYLFQVITFIISLTKNKNKSGPRFEPLFDSNIFAKLFRIA